MLIVHQWLLYEQTYRKAKTYLQFLDFSPRGGDCFVSLNTVYKNTF